MHIMHAFWLVVFSVVKVRKELIFIKNYLCRMNGVYMYNQTIRGDNLNKKNGGHIAAAAIRILTMRYAPLFTHNLLHYFTSNVVFHTIYFDNQWAILNVFLHALALGVLCILVTSQFEGICNYPSIGGRFQIRLNGFPHQWHLTLYIRE